MNNDYTLSNDKWRGMSLRNTVLSEINQAQQSRCCVFSIVCRMSGKLRDKKDIEKREGTEVSHRHNVTDMWGKKF